MYFNFSGSELPNTKPVVAGGSFTLYNKTGCAYIVAGSCTKVGPTGSCTKFHALNGVVVNGK